MKQLLNICLLLFCFFQMNAQDAPKREMRGVWIATVNNIDYPKKPTTDAIALKEQWKKLVERLKGLGINILFLQVRPAGDALYDSQFAPWSAYLTGKQGLPPAPEFDPLAYMIEVAHDNAMELHAWINPYRATQNLDTLNLSSFHVFNTNRDWMVEYGGRYYLNPGLPDVRRHIVRIVEELTNNYQIDGLHLDDYFYPYKVNNQEFPDTAAYALYGEPYGSLEDWRRNNNDELIQEISIAIKSKKPYVKFGVSPFGVWRNIEDDPIGSETRAGVRSYDDLYANVLKWLEQGWLDYVAPQLYWSIGFGPADYEVLINWWRNYRYDKMLVVGHGAYKVGNNSDKAWMSPLEIPKQIQMNRQFDDVHGSIFFSANSLLKNSLGVSDSLSNYFKYPALSPFESPSEQMPKTPKLKKVKGRSGAIMIKWKPNKLEPTNGFGLLPPDFYVIYRLPQGGRSNNPAHIVGITKREEKIKKFYDKTAPSEGIFTYVVTAVNAYRNESRPSNPIIIRKKFDRVKRIRTKGS